MPRVFTGRNTPGARVYDVDTKQELRGVLAVDIDSGQVRCAHQPYRLAGDEISTFTVCYRAIHPIYGDQPTPVLFHCYERLPEVCSARAALPFHREYVHAYLQEVLAYASDGEVDPEVRRLMGWLRTDGLQGGGAGPRTDTTGAEWDDSPSAATSGSVGRAGVKAAPAHSKSEYKRRVAQGDPNVKPPAGVPVPQTNESKEP